MATLEHTSLSAAERRAVDGTGPRPMADGARAITAERFLAAVEQLLDAPPQSS